MLWEGEVVRRRQPKMGGTSTEEGDRTREVDLLRKGSKLEVGRGTT